MVKREIQDAIVRISSQFPALIIQGPRQSGKTTFAKEVFASKPYYNFETPQTRELFEGDPVGFLNGLGENGAIFDEAQNIPELFSYLQEVIDNDRRNGKFVITGSSNFALSKNVSQSLAGRCANIKLLPFSVKEIRSGVDKDRDILELIFNGGYPAVCRGANASDANFFYQNYIETYVEKDIRRALNIKDWRVFNTFLKSLASRIGTVLEFSSISNDCGINVKTAREWLSILEQSFIVFTLPAWFRSATKRLVKSPKIYFYDTGLVCRLMGINDKSQLEHDRAKGSLFENLVILEKIKASYNSLSTNDFYYYRTSNGVEVDLVEVCGRNLNTYEIKFSQTFSSDFVKGLLSFKNDYPETTNSVVVYNGEPVANFKGCSVQKFYPQSP